MSNITYYNDYDGRNPIGLAPFYIQRNYKNVLKNLYYFAKNSPMSTYRLITAVPLKYAIIRAIEPLVSYLFIVPMEIFFYLLFYIIKPLYYYIKTSPTTLDSDIGYYSLLQYIYDFFYRIMGYVFILPFLIRVFMIYLINYVEGTIGQDNEYTFMTSLFNADIYPPPNTYQEYHVVYLLNGIGNFFTDYVTNCAITILGYWNLYYIYPINNVPIRFKVYHADTVLNRVINELQDQVPANYPKKGNIIEQILQYFISISAYNGAYSATKYYRTEMSKDFISTVMRDKPKSFSMIGLSQGGVNSLFVAEYLNENIQNPTLSYVIDRYSNLMTLDSPLLIFDNLNVKGLNSIKKYQVFNTYDMDTYFPVSDIMDAIIPISCAYVFLPHIDILFSPEMIEYIVYMLFKQMPEQWNKLPGYILSLDYFKHLTS